MVPSENRQSVVECLDEGGNLFAKIRFAHAKRESDEEPEGSEAILVVSAEEAAKQGTAPVQLRESCRYSYEIEGVDKSRGIELEPNRLISRYKNLQLLETRASAGRLHLHLTEDGKRVATGIVEIRSVKLDYLEEYRGMLRGLAEDLRGYIFDLGALTAVPMVAEWSEDPPSLAQQVEYLRTTLAGREFRGAMAQILRYPNEKLEAEQEIRPIERPFRAGKSFHSQVAMGGARTAVPESHSLHGIMKGLGIDDPSLPSKVRVASKRRTLDTPENRFVKFALKSFSRFLDHAEEIIRSGEGKRKYEPVLQDIKNLQSRIARHLAAGMFSEVGELRFVPMGSPVLQRKAGYREVLRHWLEFRLSSKIKWAGAEEVMGGGASDFDAGKKDLPALYEAWLFSQLFKLFCAKFGVSTDEKRKLLDENDPLNFVIKHGRHASFKGLKTGGHRNIQGEFAYNKSFEGNMDPRTAGSWTRILRPDFTMSFWPDGLNKTEAERTEQVVHVHFDAKYRVQSIDAIFGKDDLDDSSLDEEKKSQREGNYNRADLLKMHAYRDAIRRSEGAYVLYPGEITSIEKDNKRWKGFHELLPGLGAFAIKPASDGSAKGIEHLGKFLDEVLDLLSNGVSFLEQRRHGTARMADTHERWVADFYEAAPSILSELPGCLNNVPTGPNSSHLVSALVGWCKDEAHLQWIEGRGHYNVRLGDGVQGAVQILDPLVVGARVFVLQNDDGAIKGLWRLKKDQGAKAVLKSGLATLGYPNPRHEHYLVFPVERVPGFEATEWDLEGLKKIRPEFFETGRLGEPILVTLAEFMRACLAGAGSGKATAMPAGETSAANKQPSVRYETKRKQTAREKKAARK